MPPKFKPGGRTFPMKSKPRSLPPQAVDSIPGASVEDQSSMATSSRLNPEAEDRFEIELCWCIQQIETALISGKLNEKQMQDSKKTLNVLKSNTAPLVKKRQFMRTTFGDYRDKMAKDEKKLGKAATQVNFSLCDKNTKKSMFLKKAAIKEQSENTCDNTAAGNPFTSRNFPSDNSFRFNFSNPGIP